MSRLRKLLSSHSRFVADEAANDGVIDSVRGAYRLTASGQEVDLLVLQGPSRARCRGVGRR